MPPHGFLVARNVNSPNGFGPIAIAGFCLVGVVVLGALIWLGIRSHRRKSQGYRGPGGTFLNVCGFMKGGEFSEKTTEPLPRDIHALQGHVFSRTRNAPVVMPNKALTRPNATKADIVDYHAQAGNLPRPFTPFSFALAAGGQGVPAPVHSNRNSATASFVTATRDSFLSVCPSSNRFSVLSTASSFGQATRRKVRQIFEPVLPDELVLSVGERVTVIQSFDDGWFIVGRPSLMKADDLELGAVPAWCFVKPVKGLRAERPVRIASLGVTIQLDQPGYASREEVISWSNF